MSKRKPLAPGEIIVGNESAEAWRGCVMIVSEVHDWGGVTAYVRVPYKGRTFCRLRMEQFKRLFVSVEEVDEE